jgi:hypothetical protein
MKQSYESLLGELLQEASAEVDAAGTSNTRYARDKQAVRIGIGRFKFEALCHDIQSRLGSPWLPLEKLEAARYLALQKYRWTVEYACGLSREELMFALAEEIRDFQLPEDARRAAKGWATSHGLWDELKDHLDDPAP